MTKENEKAKEQHIALALKPWDTSLELLGFFYANRGKDLQEHNTKLQFWYKHLLQTDAMDDKEYRKEFQRILEVMEQLAVLGEKFSDYEVHEALNAVARHRALSYQSMNENYRKEAQHV